MDKKLMEKYAEFIVKVGVNVGPRLSRWFE